eukprot:CAMPEP_0172479714 /NCGR_PEP_ID=MMETSP1066-20121228/4480_1 /TAXON_ID=671091 /ORGANISM="Coscinodiscus wailesii, Strain CCMP2513" /LENGTH=117 /DNA_ID=CAMNT_0013240415 /DNA_START=60 /DNA_END=414 /DNA_ORIENTATION=-
MTEQKKDTELMILKWAGQDDVKEYLKYETDKRRMLLVLWNKKASAHRQMNEESRQEEVLKASAEEELKAACKRDIEEYKAECAERDCASLCFRREEAQIQRIEERSTSSYKKHETRR